MALVHLEILLLTVDGLNFEIVELGHSATTTMNACLLSGRNTVRLRPARFELISFTTTLAVQNIAEPRPLVTRFLVHRRQRQNSQVVI